MTTENQKFIAYFRVSTKKQGNSGLGLNSQQSIVENYVSGKGVLIASFTDIESGKNDNRVELLKAIELCKTQNAVLVIAKLDRLSRNVAFISSLLDSKVSFVCCDMPQANEFTIHIFAALAQQERKFISERTKQALNEKKKQGVKLGTPKNLTKQAQQKGVASIKNKAANNQNNVIAKELISLYLANGFNYSQILVKLQEKNIKTSRGKVFGQISQVMRLAK